MTAAAFQDATDALAAQLTSVGMTPEGAGRNAILLTAASEGAVLLARPQRSTEPLETVLGLFAHSDGHIGVLLRARRPASRDLQGVDAPSG